MDDAEFEILVDRYVDGTASPEEAGRLNRALCADKELADRFVRLTAVDADLHGLYLDQAGMHETIRALSARRSAAETKVRGISRFRAAALAAAAVLLLAAGIIAVRQAVKPATVAAPGPVAASESETALYLTDLRGELDVARAGGGPRAGYSGQKVEPGDRLVLKKGNAGLRYADGSAVELNAPAVLSILAPQKGPWLRLENGEAFFAVQNAGPARDFSVLCDSAHQVRVSGTAFELAAGQKKQTRLRVLDGRVRFFNAQGEVLVKAGQESLGLTGQTPETGRPVALSAIAAWRVPVKPAVVAQILSCEPGESLSGIFPDGRPYRRDVAEGAEVKAGEMLSTRRPVRVRTRDNVFIGADGNAQLSFMEINGLACFNLVQGRAYISHSWDLRPLEYTYAPGIRIEFKTTEHAPGRIAYALENDGALSFIPEDGDIHVSGSGAERVIKRLQRATLRDTGQFTDNGFVYWKDLAPWHYGPQMVLPGGVIFESRLDGEKEFSGKFIVYREGGGVTWEAGKGVNNSGCLRLCAPGEEKPAIVLLDFPVLYKNFEIQFELTNSQGPVGFSIGRLYNEKSELKHAPPQDVIQDRWYAYRYVWRNDCVAAWYIDGKLFFQEDKNLPAPPPPLGRVGLMLNSGTVLIDNVVVKRLED